MANPGSPKRSLKWHHSRNIALLLMVLLCTVTSHTMRLPVPGTGHKDPSQKQIEGLEKQWQTALLAGDNSAMAVLLAESYVAIGPDGTMESKSDELQARLGGQQSINQLNVMDRKIRIYGNTAVVTSKVHLRGLYSGKPIQGEFRYTRVWTFAQGQWHIVNFEANLVHDASEKRE